jgi:hypothetical protein
VRLSANSDVPDRPGADIGVAQLVADDFFA